MIPQLIREASEILEKARIPRPRWTAEQLLSIRLNRLPVELYVEDPRVGMEEAVHFRADVAARAGGMPLQYLMGTASFYGREFSVGPGVFIPRPETEALIDVALQILSERLGSDPKGPFRGQAPSDFSVIDVGTGCGAIAVTLALERPGLQIVGVDVSRQALAFASENRARHRVRVSWVEGDLLQPVASQWADLVVANLPYLGPEASAQWPRELAWEPWLALSGGRRGTEVIRRLLQDAERVIRPGGNLILEIGADQSGLLQALAGCHRLEVQSVEKDLAGLDRIAILRRQ